MRANECTASGAIKLTGPFAGLRSEDAQLGYAFSFDANRANGLYGDSSSVQPPALRLLPCIKL